MSVLTVGAVTLDGVIAAPRRYEEWGDMDRSFTRTMLFVASGASPRKRIWDITTSYLTVAEANALEAALLAAPPIACSGLTGSISAFPVVKSRDPIAGLVGVEVMSFELHEA